MSFKEQNILDQVKTLVSTVKVDCENGTALHKIEKNLFEQLLKIGHQLLELVFEVCGPGDKGESIGLDDGRHVKRLPTLHVKPYLSIFGLFDISRFVYGSREGQKLEHVPLDAHLQLPRSKFSYLLQDWGQSFAVEMPYGRVSEMFQRMFGLTLPVHSLERGNRDLSASTQAYWDKQVTTAPAEEDQIVVFSADCKGVVIRKSEEEKAEHQRAEADNHKPASFEMDQSKKRTGKKKMAVLGAVYTIDPYVRTQEQILEALFHAPGQPGAEDPPQRPKPICKHIRASMERDSDDTLNPARKTIFSWFAQEQLQRNPSTRNQTVLIMDGEEALWSMGKACLTDEFTIEVLDVIHACSYIWKAVQAIYPTDEIKDQRLTVKGYVEKMLSGNIKNVVKALRCKATYYGIKGKQLKQLQQACTYFDNNASRMRYDQYLVGGYPIASGVIEGACRHVVVDRMEGTGMRWVMEGAKSMLNLRCIHISDYWNQYMDYHIETEQEQLYSANAANDPLFMAKKVMGW